MNVGPERHVDGTTANKNSDTQEGCSVMENFAPHKISSKRFKRPVVPRVNWAAAGSMHFFFFLSPVPVWYYSFVQAPTFENFLFCSSLSFILHTYSLWSVNRLVARVTQDEKVQGSPMQFWIAKDYNGCFCLQKAACQTECLPVSRAQLWSSKKFAESRVCRIYWLNAVRLCTKQQLGKANRFLHRICSFVHIKQRPVGFNWCGFCCLLVAPWNGDFDHTARKRKPFFCRISQANKIATLQPFFAPHAQQKSYAPQFLQQCPFHVGHMSGLLLIWCRPGNMALCHIACITPIWFLVQFALHLALPCFTLPWHC